MSIVFDVLVYLFFGYLFGTILGLMIDPILDAYDKWKKRRIK
jgi:hypothetical protein